MIIKNLLSFLFVMISLIAFGQRATNFQGKISDSKSNPIPNASVYFLNTNFSAVTDSAGTFVTRGLPFGNYMVSISAIGFASINEPVSFNSASGLINFHLIESISQLDEVVVTAQKKEESLQQVPLSISALTSRKVEA